MSVTIEVLPTGGYNVIHGDKYTGCLSYGEMLEVVTTLIPPPAHNRSLNWLQTAEQHAEYEKRMCCNAEPIDKQPKLLTMGKEVE